MNGLYREDVHVCYPMFNISQAKYRRYEIMAIKTRHTQRILRICYFVIFLYFIWSTLNTNDWLSVYGTHARLPGFFLSSMFEKGNLIDTSTLQKADSLNIHGDTRTLTVEDVVDFSQLKFDWFTPERVAYFKTSLCTKQNRANNAHN